MSSNRKESGPQQVESASPRMWLALGLLSLLWVLRWMPKLVAEQSQTTRMIGFLGPSACI